jgi:hypothetical protein
MHKVSIITACLGIPRFKSGENRFRVLAGELPAATPLGEPFKASSLLIRRMCASRWPYQTDDAKPLLQHDDTK